LRRLGLVLSIGRDLERGGEEVGGRRIRRKGREGDEAGVRSESEGK
jgi:hypothetical protein